MTTIKARAIYGETFNMTLFTVREVSQLVKLKETTVTRLIREGKLEGYKPEGAKEWRIPAEALKRYIGPDLIGASFSMEQTAA
jgi:excisionase family DNA binding protein